MTFERALHDLEELCLEVKSTSSYDVEEMFGDENETIEVMWCVLGDEIALKMSESYLGLVFSVGVYDVDGTVEHMLCWPEEFESFVNIDSFGHKDDLNCRFKFNQRDWPFVFSALRRMIK